MDEKQRFCLDSYLIKSFADKIAISSTLGTINRTERIFITPTLIRKYFKNELYESESLLSNPAAEVLLEEAKGTGPKPQPNPQGPKPGTTGNTQTKQTKDDKPKKDFSLDPQNARIKRAFQALKNLNANIINDPFYRNNINFPIYIENIDNRGVPTSYDFLLLTNDLLNKSSIQEINYSDNITLIILFLKVILAPHLRIGQLGEKGDEDSQKFRAEVVKLIEFAQQKGTNPISLMFMILVSVSQAKKANNGSVGLINNTKQLIAKAFGTNLGKTLQFFDDKFPHTKDINFLLNDIHFDDIHRFFDDSSSRIDMDAKHTGYVANGVVETGIYADPVFRQYMMQKTEQYNSVLSLMNSLFEFNANDNLYVDIDGTDSLLIKFGTGENDPSIQVSQDEIIQIMDDDAMPCFMNKLRNDINLELKKAYLQFSSVLGTKVNTYARNPQDRKSYQMTNDQIKSEIDSLNLKLGQTTDPKIASQINAALGNYWKQMQTNIAFDSLRSATEKQKTDGIYKIDLQFNLRNIQTELTDLYSNALLLFLNDSNLSEMMIDTTGASLTKILTNLNNNFEMIVQKITSGIKEQIINTLMSNVQDIEKYMKQNEVYYVTGKLDELVDHFNALQKRIEDTYEAKGLIESLRKYFTDCMYSRVIQYFGTKQRLDINKLKQIQNEKNPILKKLSTPSEAKKFKSFILTEQLLVDLYNIVYFYDTQRYIGGIINTPPSTKIANQQNQIRYMLKRIGLENNIVYIIGHSGVTLQMPDFLSLTGIPLFEKITSGDLKQRCLIDWERQMWNDPKFNEYVKQASGNTKEIKDKLAKAEKRLSDTLAKLEKENNVEKQNNLNTVINNIKEEIDKHKRDLQTSTSSQHNVGIENLTIEKARREDSINGMDKPKFADEFTPYQPGYRRPEYTPDTQSGHGFQRPLNQSGPSGQTGPSYPNYSNIANMIGSPRTAGYNQERFNRDYSQNFQPNPIDPNDPNFRNRG